jgi:hypothetical protein
MDRVWKWSLEFRDETETETETKTKTVKNRPAKNAYKYYFECFFSELTEETEN